MKERIKHLLLFILLIAIDQASKFWVRTVLINRDPVVIIPKVLKLEYHTNNGAVWGLMSGKVDFLKIFTFLVLLLIIFLYFKVPKGKKYNVLKIILVFIMAGAVGNLIDRIYLNYVVDFIYFEIINFPLFNFADSCLTVSSILLFILALFYYRDDDFAFLDQIFRKKQAAKEEKNSKESSDIEDSDTSEDDNSMDDSDSIINDDNSENDEE
ncbi:MAG TPA: signal peptidase II [Mobilitalea sp.]|nr:signal peptidase II [Mobilitalea sp.]